MYWIILICLIIVSFITIKISKPIIKTRKKKKARLNMEREYQAWKAEKEHTYNDFLARREILFQARYEREMKERLGK